MLGGPYDDKDETAWTVTHADIVVLGSVTAIFRAGVKNEIDSEKIDSYLTQGESEFYDATFFKGIQKLPHSHYAYVQDGKISIHSFKK